MYERIIVYYSILVLFDLTTIQVKSISKSLVPVSLLVCFYLWLKFRIDVLIIMYVTFFYLFCSSSGVLF